MAIAGLRPIRGARHSGGGEAPVPAHRAAQPKAPAAAPLPLAAPSQPGIRSRLGGVVVDLEGAVVPSFLGKSLRAAIEMAQEAGFVLDVTAPASRANSRPRPERRCPEADGWRRFAR